MKLCPCRRISVSLGDTAVGSVRKVNAVLFKIEVEGVVNGELQLYLS